VRSAAKSNKSSGIAVGIFLAISLYTVLWAVQGARWDVDLRAATAMRWLVTLGALIPAVLGVLAMVGFPARRPFTCAGKNGIGFGGGWGEVARANRFVQLWAVDWSVATSVMAVFAITALAISGFLLVGPEVGGISPRATWFGRLRTDVSYGVPIAGLLAVVLLHGICYRQRGLVIAGSYLLRLIVVFQLVLLALSPHPRLATEWFVHIVQMVSAGMTVYGWVWYVFRRRCRTPFSGRGLFQPIQTHTLFNGALLGGLVALVIGKYLWAPNESLGWIQAVGNSVGLGTTLIYLPLFWLVYLRRSSRTWFLPLTLWGLVAVTLAVVSLERGWGLAPGRPLVILGWGWVGLAGLMAIYHGLLPRDVLHRRDLWREDVRVLAAGWRRSNLWDVTAGWALVSGLIVCLAWRGFGAQAPQFWQFYSLLATLWIVGLAIGGLRQSVAVPFWLLLLACGLVWQVTDNPPQRILPSFLDRSIVLYGLAALLIGGVWLGSYLVQRYGWRWRGERGSLAFGRLALLSCLWILAGCVVFRTSHVLLPAECLLLLCCGLYGLAALWCDREPWRVTPGALILGISASSLICSLAARSPVGWLYRDVALLLAGGIVVLLWGLGLRSLPGLVAGLRQLGVPRIAAWRAAHVRWLPIWGGLLAGVLVGSAMLLQGFSGDRLERQLACFAPLCAAVGFVWFANRVGRQWQRYAAIALFTATGLLLSWTTVPVGERWFWGTLVQTHWAMGLGFIAYGFGVAQGLRQADSWRIAIQRSASVLLMVSIVCLGLILLIELQTWADQRYQRATTTEAGLIAGMTLALAIAMVVIALVPRHQATALSMAQRQAYVYGAQLLLAALVAHAAVAMPWLWGLGLRQYWPYLAMGLSFGGIGVWRVLERRQLTVLADPLATSLFFLPAVAALLSLGFESQADRAVVMLLGGMVYGGLAMTHPGFWTRAGAFAFGNLALWLFIQKYPAWSFQQHPQLWLIPPAVTALVISRWEQDRLDPRAAASLRYISLAVIYVSSTSEIFIHGLGTHLAPPMILATLAVLGMLVGMSLKIREYIYLGALFLLVAMFTMVSHAQQQLNHVWPWWAFGISLGIATMVFFGVFEQHRNQRRRQLRGLNGTPEKGPEEGPAEDGVDPIGGRSADADAAADGRNA
jgi:hypothetical protein